VIPYPLAGALWEATATDTAIAGPVTPIVSNFNARARNGDTYRVLFGAATPQGVNPATIPPGHHPPGRQTTGKLYFDVTGAESDSVVYNAGGPRPAAVTHRLSRLHLDARGHDQRVRVPQRTRALPPPRCTGSGPGAADRCRRNARRCGGHG
jgi:hypothetical protein